MARVRPVRLALSAVVVIGAVVRVWGLGSAPLNFDESFTAMAGRLPITGLFGFLRGHDSHPPLDYLLQLPLARAGASPFLFRLPAALCSIAALALFAWWMRDRGRVAFAATTVMAISTFQIAHGREARMYAPMELIGVGAAVVADSWLRAPRRRHYVIIGMLTFIGLMTHVSMALLAVGLVVLAGRRRDGHAWKWRAAVAAGAAAWAALWGSSFVVQSRGGHSSWIPHTTPGRFVDTIGALVVNRPEVSIVVVAAVVAGSIVCWQQDRQLALVLACCFGVPAVLAGVIGLRAPLLLDRTFTVVAWGPLLALGYLLDAIIRRAPVLGTATGAIAAMAMLSCVPGVLVAAGPTAALTELESVARSGDIIAIQPPSKGVELYWNLAVRSDEGDARAIQVPGLHAAVAVALTGHRPSGRIWVMQYTNQHLDYHRLRLCAPTWHHGPTRMLCIRSNVGPTFVHTSRPTITALVKVAKPADPAR